MEGNKMPLSAERIRYLELRATIDCLLAYNVGDMLLFYGADAEKVAGVCGLPLRFEGKDIKGDPVPMCGFPVVITDVPGNAFVDFNADSTECYNALMDAGLPMAIAAETFIEDGIMQREIIVTLRRKIDRRVLRVVGDPDRKS